ncbi:MAG: hypothetical protein WKF65_10725 [Gaiellaceae bacterium]
MKRFFRRGGTLTWRATLIASILMFLLSTAIASAYTRYRYAQGTTYNFVHEGGATDGYLNRAYNKVYHPTSSRWDAKYYDSDGNLTWLERSYLSPVEQGQTIGPRRAECNDYDATSGDGNPFNCDTTVP